MKTILVTGGAGFIGSHTSLRLLEKGYKLVIIDSLVNGNEIALIRVKEILKDKMADEIVFEEGDIRDIEFLRDVFSNAEKNNYPIEAVIHFAGLKAVADSVRDPLLYWEVNVFGSITLFKIMQEFNCNNIVFSSSATIYGNVDSSPILESVKINPHNPYGETKLAVEKILNQIFNSTNNTWRIANLRYFNPIGAHRSGLIGEDPSERSNNLFPIICKVAKGIYKKLQIYGDDWPTHDGTCIRDYIHVMDLADAHISVLEHLLNNKPQVLNLNIGRGVGISVLELINTFNKVNKCSISYEYSSRRDGDVKTLIADNKKAISILKWRPKRGLEEMCIDGWKWQLKNPNGY